MLADPEELPPCKPSVETCKRFRSSKIRWQNHEKVADYALDLLDVDKYGLDHIDRTILLTMIEKFQGGPVGLIHWRRRFQKMQEHWKMCMSRIF